MSQIGPDFGPSYHLPVDPGPRPSHPEPEAPPPPPADGPVRTPDGRVSLTRRVRNKVRREVREVFEPSPPSMVLAPVTGPKVPDDSRVQEVLDLCMRIGEVQLSSGESVDSTTEVMLRIADACGLPSVDVDITFTSITICCHRGRAAAPVTTMRVLRYRTLDLKRLLAVGEVIDRVENGSVGVRRASLEISEAVEAPHPYPRWVATAGWSLLAASIAVLLGGGWITGLTAFVITGLIDRVGRVLGKRRLPAFFVQAVGGLLASGFTTILFILGWFPAYTQPSLVVAAGITVLLSGLSLVSTVQDAMTGYYVTAAGRAMEIVLLTAGLLTGVVFGLRLGLEFGINLDVAGQVQIGAVQFWVSLAAAAMAAAAYALAGYAPLRSVVASALAGAVGWSVSTALDQYLGLGPVESTGAAAVVVGMAAGLFRRGGGVPPLIITLAGITPLLPGLTVYRGFYQLAVENSTVAEGISTIMLALTISVALAAGVALGDYITRPRRRSTGSNPDPSPASPPA